jgi:hypothetical protein
MTRSGAGDGWAAPVRIAQRILAMTTAIWHNYRTGQPISRLLIAHDH